MKSSRVPEDFHTITPHLVVRGVAAALEWYTRAFDAHELLRHPAPDGERIMHAEMLLGDSRFFIVDEYPEHALSPLALGGTPVTLHLYVEDVDALFERAVDAGATEEMPVQDTFWGDRYGMMLDPFGHRWSIASRLEDLSPQQLKERAENYAKENPY